jgi:hypothetical protein
MGDRGQGMIRGLAVALAVLASGCRSTDPAETQAPTSTVNLQAAAQAAVVAQESDQNREVSRGAGQSMAPIYGDNTILLIAPIAYTDLRPGMNVAYRNPAGDRIVHTLMYPENGYWVARGLNNPAPDRDYVTPQNLIGVVYGSFQSDDPAVTPEE